MVGKGIYQWEAWKLHFHYDILCFFLVPLVRPRYPILRSSFFLTELASISSRVLSRVPSTSLRFEFYPASFPSSRVCGYSRRLWSLPTTLWRYTDVISIDGNAVGGLFCFVLFYSAPLRSALLCSARLGSALLMDGLDGPSTEQTGIHGGFFFVLFVFCPLFHWLDSSPVEYSSLVVVHKGMFFLSLFSLLPILLSFFLLLLVVSRHSSFVKYGVLAPTSAAATAATVVVIAVAIVVISRRSEISKPSSSFFMFSFIKSIILFT